ncbi:hypothetical protein RUND412_005142 [Rhizina undulata]
MSPRAPPATNTPATGSHAARPFLRSRPRLSSSPDVDAAANEQPQLTAARERGLGGANRSKQESPDADRHVVKRFAVEIIKKSSSPSACSATPTPTPTPASTSASVPGGSICSRVVDTPERQQLATPKVPTPTPMVTRRTSKLQEQQKAGEAKLARTATRSRSRTTSSFSGKVHHEDSAGGATKSPTPDVKKTASRGRPPKTTRGIDVQYYKERKAVFAREAEFQQKWKKMQEEEAAWRKKIEEDRCHDEYAGIFTPRRAVNQLEAEEEDVIVVSTRLNANRKRPLAGYTDDDSTETEDWVEKYGTNITPAPRPDVNRFGSDAFPWHYTNDPVMEYENPDTAFDAGDVFTRLLPACNPDHQLHTTNTHSRVTAAFLQGKGELQTLGAENEGFTGCAEGSGAVDGENEESVGGGQDEVFMKLVEQEFDEGTRGEVYVMDVDDSAPVGEGERAEEDQTEREAVGMLRAEDAERERTYWAELEDDHVDDGDLERQMHGWKW